MSGHDTIRRLDQWLSRNRPDYHGRLLPGADRDAVSQLQRRYPRIPRFLIDLYQWRNGQDSDDYESMYYNNTFLNVREIHGALDALEDADELIESFGPNAWHPGWIPLLGNGGGDYLCVDTEDSLGIGSPSVVWFLHDDAWRRVIAPSADAWCEAFVESLERGMWEKTEDGFFPRGHEPDVDPFDDFVAEKFPGFPRDAVPPR